MQIDFVQALREIEKEKEIPFETLARIIEDALVSAYRKHYGSIGEIHVEIDVDESRAAVYPVRSRGGGGRSPQADERRGGAQTR